MSLPDIYILLGTLSLASTLNKIYTYDMNSNELFVQMMAERAEALCFYRPYPAEKTTSKMR